MIVDRLPHWLPFFGQAGGRWWLGSVLTPTLLVVLSLNHISPDKNMSLKSQPLPSSEKPAETLNTVEKAVLGEDEPLAKSHPAAVGGIVFLTYPIIFIVMLLVAIALLAAFRR